MKSVIFRPTGKFNSAGQEEKEPIFLPNHLACRKAGSMFKTEGDPTSGLDMRLNAAGDSPENATGYQILLDTMTYVKSRVSQQSFYELNAFGQKPSDFVPITVGDGSWAANILTRREYQNGGDFESGLTRQSGHNARSINAVPSMDSITLPTFIWDAAVEYSLPELQQAMMANNWDLIAAKHRARAKIFQLGIQDLVFLGTKSKNMEGLLVNTATPVNTTRITAPISGLNAANFLTFVQNIVNDFFVSSNSTRFPTHFVMPMSDYLGLMTLVPGSAGTFPVPMLDYLDMAFKKLCGPNFKITATAYGNAAVNNAKRGTNKNIYALYRFDEEAFRMDIPVDYTVGQPNTADNFHFIDIAYAQITGVGFYKPLETLIFQY